MLTTRCSCDVYLQGSERGAYDKITAKMTEAPGPGYYNYRSDFDLPEHGGNSYADTNFLMQLNAARKRQSAVFESRTGRDALMQVCVFVGSYQCTFRAVLHSYRDFYRLCTSTVVLALHG
jgi:hypothetical protein